MIQLTQEELSTWNLLNNTMAQTQGELQRLIAARDDYVVKLEQKYNVTFDRVSGQFIPKDGGKDKPAAKAELAGKKEATK